MVRTLVNDGESNLAAVEARLLGAVCADGGSAAARRDLLRVWLKTGNTPQLARALLNSQWRGDLDHGLATAIGRHLLKMGCFEPAASAFDAARALHPADARAHRLFAHCLLKIGSVEQAVAPLLSACALRPHDPNCMTDLARCLAISHQASRDPRLREEAVRLLDAAIAIDPGCVPASFRRALIHEEDGEFEAARGLLERAVEVSPEFLPALTSLLEAGAESSAELAARIERLAGSASHPPLEQARAFRALGKRAERSAEYDRAFAFFEKANRVAGGGSGHDPKAHAAYVDRLIEHYSADFFARAWRVEREDRGGRYVFVIGMPRSGTTLVEQVLACHPQVAAAGELSYFLNLEKRDQALHASDGGAPPDLDRRLCAEGLARIASGYRTIADGVSRDAVRVVDKMPFNFTQLGTIAATFPDARIICCERHPADVGLSCFVEAFNDDMPFAQTLEDIGWMLRDHRRLTAHWHRVLGARIFTVTYEDLVRDFDTVARGAIGWLGLDWDPRCARFHERAGTVQTPSKRQVRQPLYAGSIGRWKRFEKHLSPLIGRLGEQ